MPLSRAPRLSGSLCLALLSGACAPDKDPLDSASSPTAASNSGGASSDSNSGGSNSGGTDGGTDGGGTDGTGSASNSGGTEATTAGPTSEPTGATTSNPDGEPAQICIDYLICVASAQPDLLPEVEMAFGPESQCWSSGPAVAEECALACSQGLEALGQQFPDDPSCGGGGGNTTDPSTTTGDPPVGEWGYCGWSAQSGYYACLGEPGFPDPNGTYPIDCPPNLPEPGAPCGELDDIGCCTPNGDNYYCGQDGVVVENCGP